MVSVTIKPKKEKKKPVRVKDLSSNLKNTSNTPSRASIGLDNTQRFFVGKTPVSREQFRIATGKGGGVKSPQLIQREQELGAIQAKKERLGVPFLPAPQEGQPNPRESEQVREENIRAAFAPTLEEIEQNIQNPPSLEPEPVGDVLTESNLVGDTAGNILNAPIGTTGAGAIDIGTSIGNFVSKTTGIGTPVTSEQAEEIIGNTRVGKVMAGLGLGAALALGGAAVIPAMKIAGSKIMAGKIGSMVSGLKSYPFLTTAVGTGLGVTLGGLGLSNLGDIKGDEINNLRGEINSMEDYSGKIKQSVEAGHSPADAIKQIREMEQRIQEVEARLQDLGNFNINFRMDKDYVEIQADIKKTRREMANQLLEIQNLGLQGQSDIDPAELMLAYENLK